MTILPYLVLALAAPAADAHDTNPVYKEIRTQGVAIGAKDPYVLPAPYMPDGLKPADQKTILEKLSEGPNPKKPFARYKDVIERSGAAPRYLDQMKIKGSDPAAPAWGVDIWFVTFGDLNVLAQRDPQSLFGTNPQGAVMMELNPQQLKDRGIDLNLKAPLRERYVNTEADLLDAVHLSLTSRIVASETGESLVVASKVDPRFTKDAQFPNFWNMLPDDKKPAGPKNPMDTGAFYLKITKLAEPKDGLFVEFHQVSTEPKEWFNGGPILRGKIPLWVDQEVKKFRLSSMKTAPAP